MRKICIIMGGVLPVPAVRGGAVETLVSSIAKKHRTNSGIELTICSVYDKQAVEASKQYPNVRFFWTHTRSIKNLFLHSLFLAIRMTTGKAIRPLQRHYNELTAFLQTEAFDLIIAEGGDTQAIADIAKGYRREQLINHIHIHYLPPENIVQNYGHVIGVSQFVTEEYLKCCSTSVTPHVLKNAIDIERFSQTVSHEEKAMLRQKLGFEEQDFIVLYVGRIMQIKGILELMQAVLDLNDPKIKLLMMGSANSGKVAFSAYEREVKQLCEQHKDKIIFTGYIDNTEVYRYASIADVQCLPTLCKEAAPLVLLEAMAEGLPIISTDSGGVAEYIDEHTALFIQRDGIIENLKNAISYMKDHPEMRKQMSDYAKQHSKQFDEAVYYHNFLTMIETIVLQNERNDYKKK